MRETLGFHPLANVFPLIEGQAFLDLVDDVRVKGVRHKIILFEGLILDGRNRYRAAEAADVDQVPYETFAGTYREALGLVISENLHRRHLTDNQRQYVAAKIANMAPGRPSEETPPIGGISMADAAKMLNVALRGVERAKQIQRDAEPALAAAVERGLVPIDMAARASKETTDIQAQVVAAAESGKFKNLNTILKRAARTAREKELGAKQRALPDKKYGVILADPEWKFAVYSEQTGQDRAAANHYPTSTTDAIAARPVGDIAADDCLLLLWATNPMLPDALRVVTAWGFKFKTMRTWVKDVVAIDLTPEQAKTGLGGPGRTFIEMGPAGTGFWNRDRSEHLIIATRGNVPAPSMGTQGESVIFAARPHLLETERDKHSAKPDDVHEWVEEHFPNLPKIELNARAARRGWDIWGNEALDTPHDPLTGEVLDLPPPRPERSRLLPDKERLAVLTDANGMVQIDETHVVAAAFVTSGEIAQAEAYAAKLSNGVASDGQDQCERDEEQPAGDDGDTGGGDHEDKRGLHIHACDRVEQEGDRDPAAGGDKTAAEGHHDGAGRAAAPEGLVLPLRDGPESIGLYVGGKFVATTKDRTPAEQYVEQNVPPPPRAPDAPEPMEIPAFLRRTKDPEAAD